MRPRSLTGRIVAAFVILSVAGWLAIGATMFVALRVLHAEAKTSALGDVTQTITFRFRNATADGELRQAVNRIRAEVGESAITVHVIRANGSLLEITGDVPDPTGRIVIPADARRGEVVAGTIEYSDGQPHLYAATVLSAPGAGGPRAVLLSTVDRSGADALRDVLRTLPIVILVTLLIGVPLAVLLARSVTAPLRRLAAATASLPAAGRAPFTPLPLDGPTEVRELTDRFNAMSAELGATRERESELPGQPAARPADAADRHRGLRDGAHRWDGHRRQRHGRGPGHLGGSVPTRAPRGRTRGDRAAPHRHGRSPPGANRRI